MPNFRIYFWHEKDFFHVESRPGHLDTCSQNWRQNVNSDKAFPGKTQYSIQIVCVYVSPSTCLFIHEYILCACVCVCVYLSLCVRVDGCVRVWLSLCVCLWESVCVCWYIIQFLRMVEIGFRLNGLIGIYCAPYFIRIGNSKLRFGIFIRKFDWKIWYMNVPAIICLNHLFQNTETYISQKIYCRFIVTSTDWFHF